MGGLSSFFWSFLTSIRAFWEFFGFSSFKDKFSSKPSNFSNLEKFCCKVYNSVSYPYKQLDKKLYKYLITLLGISYHNLGNPGYLQAKVLLLWYLIFSLKHRENLISQWHCSYERRLISVLKIFKWGLPVIIKGKIFLHILGCSWISIIFFSDFLDSV